MVEEREMKRDEMSGVFPVERTENGLLSGNYSMRE